MDVNTFKKASGVLFVVAGIGAAAAVILPQSAFGQGGGPQAPPSAPVTVVNTDANAVPVRGALTVGGQVAAQQSGPWTVTAEETFAPGRSPKRYGPVSAGGQSSTVVVPPVASGQTFILTHLNAIGYSNIGIALTSGQCGLFIKVGTTSYEFFQMVLAAPNGMLTGSEQMFVPIGAGEGLDVHCNGRSATGSVPQAGFTVTVGGYFVPAAE